MIVEISEYLGGWLLLRMTVSSFVQDTNRKAMNKNRNVNFVKFIFASNFIKYTDFKIKK